MVRKNQENLFLRTVRKCQEVLSMLEESWENVKKFIIYRKLILWCLIENLTYCMCLPKQTSQYYLLTSY